VCLSKIPFLAEIILKGLGIQWTGLSSLSQLKTISSTLSAWKTPIITFAEHSKPHPRSHNPDTLYVAMPFFFTHKANSPTLPPQKRKFLSIYGIQRQDPVRISQKYPGDFAVSFSLAESAQKNQTYHRRTANGSRKNNFTEFSLRFRLDLADLNERSHRNSNLFRGLHERRSTEDDLKIR
jgi:hypothetical protein